MNDLTIIENNPVANIKQSTDVAGACKEILRWDKFQGQPLAGLTHRRQREYKLCMGNV